MKYAELHAKSNFSFLQAASHPDELIERAAHLGYYALAITDRNTLAGIVRAHVAAKQTGLKLIIGAEITLQDAPPVVLWATDRRSYGRLCRLITTGRRRAPKGHCFLHFEDLAEHAEGLIAGIIPWWEQTAPDVDQPCNNRRHKKEHNNHPGASHSKGFRIFHSSENYTEQTLYRWLCHYRELFQDRCYLLVELHHEQAEEEKIELLRCLSNRTKVPLVAAGDVHYHVRKRKALHDVLTAVRYGTTVREVKQHLFANAERHLRSLEEIARIYAKLPEALHRTCEIADRCTFNLDQLRYEYPQEIVPEGMRPIDYLRHLTWQGAAERYPHGVPEKVRQQLEHELQLIEELGYEAYFLTVWDLVRFARSRNILCQGRGSAANSAVCYCLGITAVDPDRIDVLFERFVSRERNEAPDIDVDFEHQRREEVIQYIYEKYGRDRAGMTAEVITYQARSAVRDVGKALGLSLDRIDRLAKSLEHFHSADDLPQRCHEVGIDPTSRAGRQFVRLVNELIGFPRHLSQHTGGMVITQGPLCELVPLENAAMEGRTVIEWNKDDLDELGILKVDCLALGMLTAIHRCFDLVEKHYGKRLTLASIPEGDIAVYDMISRADTVGVFQIESRAQMSMLPRLKPRCFYDLVIEVAIVRPGPIIGKMVHPYLRRRAGLEQPAYPNDEIRRILEKTLGVPLFQEQVMRLAVVAAGFTPGEADQLRRAMGAWRRPGLIEQFRRRLLEGMRKRGIPEHWANVLFEQIRGFGEYGFPESHAASFALLVYASAWLKCHYQAAFTAAMLNSQPMGFYAPAQLVDDARRHGVTVLPVDINYSHWETTLEALPPTNGQTKWAIRLGLHMLTGFRRADAERIIAARRAGKFTDLEDLTKRTGLRQAALLRLAKAGALASLGMDRRTALWQVLAQKDEPLPLFENTLLNRDATCQTPISQTAEQQSPKQKTTFSDHLPPISTWEEVLADYFSTGLSLKAHPMELLRRRLARAGIVTAAALRRLATGSPARVAGIVLVRQRPCTAGGITFFTLEDETGFANLVVKPNVWSRYRQAAMHAVVLLAEGRVERQGEVVNLVCRRLIDLSRLLGMLNCRSRDFC